MTGRNRKERLSDAQRSALWYCARGYAIHRSLIGPSGACWLRDPAKGESALPLHHRVLDALLARGLVESDAQERGAVRYRLTARGREVADGILEFGKGWA